jgi:eukaryotic-like serine/threonine-protein kinase
MVASICTNERSNWMRLVDDELSATETQELTLHLESCLSCRAKFESICVDASWWQGSSSTLRLIETESGIFKAREDAGRHTDGLPAAKDSPLVVISGLKPTHEAGALGELGEYVIREVIGYGGMGTVLKAWDKRLSRVVAIKVLHPHLAMSSAARVRFAREAQSVASISHPNVVPIHDVADDNSQPYIVMGYVQGGSLQERLDREGPLSLEESLRIGLQIAEGLEAAHSHGLVHRDIKPANILLEARWHRVLITDFGLARALDDASITASGQLAGTPQYMSPEQSRGDTIDHRSDLFSLGSVLYTMLSGRPPFRAESAVAVMQKVSLERARPVYEVQDNLPFWTHQLIERLHAKNPNDRVPTAVEASDLIRSCLQHVQNPSSGGLPRGFHVVKTDVVRPIIQCLAVMLTIMFLAIALWNWIVPTIKPNSTEHIGGQSQAGIRGPSTMPPKAFPQYSAPAREVPWPHEASDWNGSIDAELDVLTLEISESGFEFFK